MFPGEFVSKWAEISGFPEAKIAVIDRHLANAGLRPAGARGVNAPQMDVAGASNLLIGTMCSLVGYEAKDLGKVVADFRAFDDFFRTDRYDRTSDYLVDLRKAGVIEEMIVDPRMKTFGGAMELMLELIMNRRFKEHLEAMMTEQSMPPRIRVQIERDQKPHARIYISTPRGEGGFNFGYPFPPNWQGGAASGRSEEERRFKAKVARNHPPQNVGAVAYVTQRELLQVAGALAPNAAN